ncbi:hypothetical protein F9K50_03330, partial [bacterium]
MQAVVRKFSYLIYFLTVQLLLPPGLWAKASPAAGAPPVRLKVAVVELYDGKVKPEVVEKVADT